MKEGYYFEKKELTGPDYSIEMLPGQRLSRLKLPTPHWIDHLEVFVPSGMDPADVRFILVSR